MAGAGLVHGDLTVAGHLDGNAHVGEQVAGDLLVDGIVLDQQHAGAAAPAQGGFGLAGGEAAGRHMTAGEGVLHRVEELRGRQRLGQHVEIAGGDQGVGR